MYIYLFIFCINEVILHAVLYTVQSLALLILESVEVY
jgi:hypothetical protein